MQTRWESLRSRRGHWQLGWHFFRVEQEAIMSALGESDWRAPSNVLQQRFAATLMLHDHVQALFTWYRGRTLNRGVPGAVLVPNLPPGIQEPWANRLYFDVLRVEPTPASEKLHGCEAFFGGLERQ